MDVATTERTTGWEKWKSKATGAASSLVERLTHTPDQLERKQKKNATEQMLVECGKAFPEETVPEATRGELIGLATGARPAAIFGSQKMDLETVAKIFNKNNIPVIVAGTALVNEKLVEARLNTDSGRKLATSFGWDLKRTVKENVENLQYTLDAPPADLARVGFILGYPNSAIEHFNKVMELKQSQEPRIPNLFELEPSPEWDAADQETARYIQQEKDAVEGKIPSDMPNREKLYLAEAYDASIRAAVLTAVQNIYRKYYGLGDAEIKLLTNSRFVHSFSPSGERISSFMVSGEEGRKSADVEEVLKNVEDKTFAGGY